MAYHQTRNGGTGTNHQHHHHHHHHLHLHDDSTTNIYFIVGGRMETATYRADHITDAELKELFRCAAEAGPLDIVKLRKDEKLVNISVDLPANSPDTAYVLQVVGTHPTSVGMIEAEVLRALEMRVAALERELQDHQEAVCTAPSHALLDLKRQVDNFRNKLETTEHLSWLGFYKELPEPISSEACRRLQYRRKSDSLKRRVRERFLNICDVAVSSSARQWLRSPAFDARQWEDEELLLMLQTMFAELELPRKFNIPLPVLRNFLHEVYNNYNEVPFHNFRHCFCVAQMMYAVIWAADLPRRIGDLEVLILIVSCICHDLDHPGYNNIYQINARTELALRYNDISPLENHHCSVAFRVLEAPECNVFAALDSTTYRVVREGIIRCILATDMARHNEILAQFTDIVPEFDYASKAHVNLLTMILIKVADISNEARPMDVAEPWLDRLLQEFFKQSDAEKLEGLPVTPFMDRDKVTKPSSQCSFIGFVLLPLFEILGELFPELQDLIVRPAREALDYYRRLNEAAKDERHQRKSIVDMGESTGSMVTLGGATATATATATAMAAGSEYSATAAGSDSSTAAGSDSATETAVVKSTSSQSVRSKRSAGTINSRSRSTEDDIAENSMIEETEFLDSSDAETATEVEVSEKALKFKISTEGTMVGPTAGRRSCPGSRKGSREKSSLDYHNHEMIARVIRENEREIFRCGRFDGRSAMKEKEKKKGENGESREVGSPRSDSSDACTARCCCDEKTSTVNHKSFLSRLRNFTDRLSMSFDTKDAVAATATATATATAAPAAGKPSKHTSDRGKIGKEGNSILPTLDSTLVVCKRCNRKEPKSVELSNVVDEDDKRAMTLPKAKRSEDGKNRSWRAVFLKEKRSSASLEMLPAVGVRPIPKHRRYSSNPEGKSAEFGVMVVRPEGKRTVAERLDEIGKVEIRRSSASMEDISKITKETVTTLLGGSLEEKKKTDEYQHTGSLDSMLCKESRKMQKKPIFSSAVSAKKSSPSLFSRFKSGMSIDGVRNSSGSGSGNGNGNGHNHSYAGSLHDHPHHHPHHPHHRHHYQQQQQQQQSQSGWISSLTASLRSKRQTSESNWRPQPSARPTNREEIK